MNRKQAFDCISNKELLKKIFIMGDGRQQHQFAVEILFDGRQYCARFLPYGRDTGYSIVITKQQMFSFIERHYED